MLPNPHRLGNHAADVTDNAHNVALRPVGGHRSPLRPEQEDRLGTRLGQRFVFLAAGLAAAPFSGLISLEALDWASGLALEHALKDISKPSPLFIALSTHSAYSADSAFTDYSAYSDSSATD
ncbi:hypothetical protein NDU88_002560 [Pleurodeles waltl]|uniref:Uncharacterized protein n=1 Tax=Pleurodeles waltl TaxID=8319 RepID=A0AAV7WS20_PLEWA|nr:hypothetical protein NDU88_002560 [Pleurodeles waltl]